MELISLSTVERLASAAANTDDLQFTNWRSISLAASLDTSSINIAGLVISALCNDEHSQNRHGAPSSITQGIELRERFVLNLLRCAVYDFHRSSNTHLFFGFYTSISAVRAFHAFKDKAFTTFLIESGKLAVETEIHTISEWNAYLEGSDRPELSISPFKEPPCSGAVNFRIHPSLGNFAQELTEEMSVSFNNLAVRVLDGAIEQLDPLIRKTGITAIGTRVRKFGRAVDQNIWKQKTVRIPKSSHAILIGYAHELSVSVSILATYLFNWHVSTSYQTKPSAEFAQYD